MGAESRLEVSPRDGHVTLKLPQAPKPTFGGLQFHFEAETSVDLSSWFEIGRLDVDADNSGNLRVPLDPQAQRRFFRVRQDSVPGGSGSPESMLGYQPVFEKELTRIGFPTLEEFARRHFPPVPYLERVSWDVTTAKYWPEFSADPAAVNALLPPGTTDRRIYDFRLSETELALFKKNGFVVSERLGSYSFADVLYRVFTDDLPVFISADAILHAWHYSFQRMLEEIEETQLEPRLRQVIDNSAAAIPEYWAKHQDGPLRSSIEDADYFLAVAGSLATGTIRSSSILDASTSERERRIRGTLSQISQLEFQPGFPLWSDRQGRMMDFSQFKIRGHYERSPGLGRYFQTFMWAALADLNLLETNQLGTAVVLNDLLNLSGQRDAWREVDGLLRIFVGHPDATTFDPLDALLSGLGPVSGASLLSADDLRRLKTAILSSSLDVPQIAGPHYFSPFGPKNTRLAPHFTFTGQRFVPDGWAIQNLVYGRITWNEELPGKTVHQYVIRRYASAADVAFTLFGNQNIAPLLVSRISAEDGVRFRDGLPYHHHLEALQTTFDQQSVSAWEHSIYTRWLWALRALSEATTGTEFPEAMRTEAWAMKTVNSQLASWTQLKHDTVLYAKQPYTGIAICEYPAGFVEPRVEFWRRMQALADSTADALASYSIEGWIPNPASGMGWGFSPTIDLRQRWQARVSFCRGFAQQVKTLTEMAIKEVAGNPFSDEEVAFIRGMMNRQDLPYTGRSFNGWYPELFYDDYGSVRPREGSDKHDPLVTDVHTAPPDHLDPTGGVLHQAVGNVDLLVIAVDNGPDHAVYAGPVLSHYEQVIPGPKLQRMTDSEWQGILSAQPRRVWPRPEWTRGYLVPAP